jgi:glycosyltransferase involved in cell wall biosynthesis
VSVNAMISAGGNLGHVLPEVNTASRGRSLLSRAQTVPQESSGKFSIALLTPWNQQCGNAEFAKRLTSGFTTFATVEPIELENLIEHDTLDSRRKQELYISKLIKQVRASDADLVHIQHEFSFFGRARRYADRRLLRLMRNIRKPIILSLHTWKNSMCWKSEKPSLKSALSAIHYRMKNRRMRRCLLAADGIVVHSKDTYAKIIKAYPKLRKRVHLLPIPVEPVMSDGVTAPYQKRPGEKWLVLPGFVSRYKGHRHIIDAMPSLPSNFRFVIAGGVHPKDRLGHEYWSELLSRIDEVGCQDRVVFTGFLDDSAEQAAVLKQADVFVLPYDEVGQSGSAVLADVLSCGRPIVTSLARSMFVYRHGNDTVYSSSAVDVEDVEKLRQAIIDAADPASSPRRRLHQRNVQRKFCLHQMATQYKLMYESVLAGNSRRSRS